MKKVIDQKGLQKKTNAEGQIKNINNFANNLLKLIGTKATAATKLSEDKENIFVEIDSKDETGLLIGNRGKTLESLQLIIGIFARQTNETSYRVIVNVGDWRQKENERLEKLAEQTANRAIETEKEQVLYNLNPTQRRIIHVFLSENDKVVTRSEGEGEERYLIVAPK